MARKSKFGFHGCARSKFFNGDEVSFSEIVSARSLIGSKLKKHDNLIVIDRRLRERASDARPNRYMVTDAATGRKSGWFDEEDLVLS